MSGAVLIFWSLILISSQTCHAQNQVNITLGDSLTSGTSNSSWRSPSGDFAFGFYPLTSGLFLVGIWFDNIQEKTLVWSANRDDPVPSGSTANLTSDGQLSLTHRNGTVVTIYSGEAATSGSMRDDGNFILMNSVSQIVWQSFDSPTDTILPNQTLQMSQKLYSNANTSSGDFSRGRFRLELQYDGNLVLSANHFAEPGYWYTSTLYPVVSLVFNESSVLMYVMNSTAIVYRMTNESDVRTPVSSYYHRATVTELGNFQQFIHPKIDGTRWTPIWSAISQPCTVSGVCGAYGYCTSPDNQTAECSCFPGYTFLDPKVPYSGCYPEFPLEQCGNSQVEYTTQIFADSDFPNDEHADLEQLTDTNLENCRKAVMDDCHCVAASFNVSICRKKRVPFMTARKSNPATNGVTAIVKVPVNYTLEGKKDSRKTLIVCLSVSCFFVIILAIIALYYHPIAQKCGLRKLPPVAYTSEVNLRRFTFLELKEATKDFSNKIGRGSFGTVCSGILISEDKQIEIAVKKLEKVIEQGEKEFLTEVKIIGQTHHKHLVKLLGFCNEQNHRLLVYELMKNGPLSGFLYKEGEKPNWNHRAQIVLEIARGLLYLHEECETQIIHCDIKPQNVLLDEQYHAKIADFGLAKLLMKDQTRTSTNIRGTMGYMAPEWLKHAPVTAKVDVYSFGVMLMEIICCRRHIELGRVEEESEEDDLVLTDWVLRCVRIGKLNLVVGDDLDVLGDFKRFERMALVGLWCVQPDPILRPTTKKVVQMLEGSVEVGIPPIAYAQTMAPHTVWSGSSETSSVLEPRD